MMGITATNEDQGMAIYVGLRDYQHRDDQRYIEDWMAVKWGSVYNGCHLVMSTETPGDIASANYFYLRTLYMNYCVFQHVKLPLWLMKKLGIES